MPSTFNYTIDRSNVTIRTLRYDQNEQIKNNVTRTNPNEYLSDVINSNNTIFSNDNTILYGLECFVISVVVQTIKILVTPGVALSQNQIIQIPAAYELSLTLPPLPNLTDFSTLGIFLVRTEVAESSPTFKLELHGLKTDESYVSDGEVSAFNPILADPKTYNLLQFFKYELDISNNFTKILHKNVYQHIQTNSFIDTLVSNYGVTASSPGTYNPNLLKYDIVNPNTTYEKFITTNNDIMYNRFNVFPDNVVDEQCFINTYCNVAQVQPQLTKWIIPQLTQYVNYPRSRIRRITGTYE